jgi:hypothetical protein
VIADYNGNYTVIPSNASDCTWRQAGVFGVTQGDTRFSSVPADGWITSVSIRSGSNPAPLSFVVFRQLGASGFGENSQCCFFVSETGLVRPQPNAISTFRTFIPVQRNTIDGVRAFDLFGVSAPAGAGSLPLAQVGTINNFVQFTPGSVNAGYFYPRIGSIPNDAGGGRREEGIPGIELLVQFTFCPATDGAAFCSAIGSPGGVTAAPASGPTLLTPSAQVAGNRARLGIGCLGVAECRGRLQVFRANGRRVQVLGTRRFQLAGGTSGEASVVLNLTRAARRALGTTGLAAGVRFVQASGTISQAVTLTR